MLPMFPRILRRTVASLASLFLCAVLAWPAATASAAQPGSTLHLSRHPRVYGYLMDRHPSTDSVLLIYSKTHKTTYQVYMERDTVVKVHTQVVPRARLSYHLYVIVTCQSVGGKYQAITVHIEYNYPHHRKKK